MAGASIPPNANDANPPPFRFPPSSPFPPSIFPSLHCLFPFPNTPFPPLTFPSKRPPEIGKGYVERFIALPAGSGAEPRPLMHSG